MTGSPAVTGIEIGSPSRIRADTDATAIALLCRSPSYFSKGLLRDLEPVSVGILPAHAPPPDLEHGDVHRYEEELAVDIRLGGLERADPTSGMLRTLE